VRPLEEQFGDTKGVIRIRKSKDRQRNGQKNDLQNTTQNSYSIRQDISLSTGLVIKKINVGLSNLEAIDM
jgi:hypothetical protein